MGCNTTSQPPTKRSNLSKSSRALTNASPIELAQHGTPSGSLGILPKRVLVLQGLTELYRGLQNHAKLCSAFQSLAEAIAFFLHCIGDPRGADQTLSEPLRDVRGPKETCEFQ